MGTEKHLYEPLSTQPNFARGERSTMNPSHEGVRLSFSQGSDGALSSLYSYSGTPPHPLRTTFVQPLFAARVICLARDCEVNSVLPLACYELGAAYNSTNPNPDYGDFDRLTAKRVLTAEDCGHDYIQHWLPKSVNGVPSVRPPLRIPK